MRLNLVNCFVLLILVLGFSELGSRSRTRVSAVTTVASNDETHSPMSVTPSLAADSDNVSSTASGLNDTVSEGSHDYLHKIETYLSAHKGVILRSLLVLASVTGIVLVYLFIRCIWVRNGRSKSKKYGLITRLSDDNLEMRPLDADDDEDEDMTVFERASQKPSRKPPSWKK